jgi:hypothetical protein
MSSRRPDHFTHQPISGVHHTFDNLNPPGLVKSGARAKLVKHGDHFFHGERFMQGATEAELLPSRHHLGMGIATHDDSADIGISPAKKFESFCPTFPAADGGIYEYNVKGSSHAHGFSVEREPGFALIGHGNVERTSRRCASSSMIRIRPCPLGMADGALLSGAIESEFN